MSKHIDTQIVEMRFDNEQFEQGAQQTQETLKNLKKSVNDLGQDTSDAGMGKLSAVVTTVTDKFNVLQKVAEGALFNIGMRAEAAGERLIKNLTVDQLGAGFTKYEEKTKAVQTIMNATGDSIEDVNAELEKLMWFTDETSYNFTDMTNNIGKFTSQGVNLKRSVTAMQGIATWAAKSGQGVNEASRAMYNLSQALGVGKVKVLDWMSIENANMATQEFKMQVIETAKELGVLSEEAEYAKGKVVTALNFRDTLADGWFTSDVLIATLQKYGDYADLVREIVEKTGLTAAEAMAEIEGMYEGVGESAFKAAQEAKTFSEAIDATKDAVSTGWLETFEIIFGNYEEAKTLWTDLANGLYDVFAGGAEDRNQMLEDWKELGGRTELIEGLTAAAQNLVQILDILKEAWNKAFPQLTGNILFEWTQKFNKLMQNLHITEWAADQLSDALGGLLSIFRAGASVVSAFLGGTGNLFVTANQLLGILVGLAGAAGRYMMSLSDVVTKQENLNKITAVSRTIFNAFFKVFEIAQGGVAAVADILLTAFDKFDFKLKDKKKGIDEFFGAIGDGFKMLATANGVEEDSPLFRLVNGIGDFFTAVKDAIETPILAIGRLLGIFEEVNAASNSLSGWHLDLSGTGLSEGLINLGEALGQITNELGDFLKSLEPAGTIAKNAFESIKASVDGFITYVATRLGKLSLTDMVDSVFVLGLASFIDGLKKSLKDIKEIATAFVKPFQTVADSVKKTLEEYQKKIKADAIKSIAISLAILAASLVALALVPTGRLFAAVGAMGALALIVGILTKSMDKMVADKDAADKLSKVGTTLMKASVLLIAIAAALSTLAKYDPKELAVAFVALTTSLGVTMAAISKISTVKVPKKSIQAVKDMTKAVAALVVPLVVLAKLSPEGLVQGGVAIGGIILAMTMFVQAISMTSGADLTKVSGSLVALGVAVNLMVIPLLALVAAWKLVEEDDIFGGFISLFALMAGLTMAAMLLSKSTGEIAKGSLAFIAMAAALNMLIIPLTALTGLAATGFLADAVLALAGAILALGTAAGVLSFVGPGVLAVGAAFALFAGGIGIVILAIAALVAAVASCAKAIPELILGIAALGLIPTDQIEAAMNNLNTIFEGVLTTIESFLPRIITIFGRISAAVVASVIVAVERGALVLVIETLALFEELGPALFDGLKSALDVFNEKFPELSPSLNKFAYNLSLGLWRAASWAAQGILDGIWEGLVVGINELGAQIKDSSYLIADILLGPLVHDAIRKTEKAGEDSAAGYVKGLESGAEPAKKVVDKVATGTINQLEKSSTVNSPGKEQYRIGSDAILGYVQGQLSMLKPSKLAANVIGTSSHEELEEGALGNGTDTKPKKTGIKFIDDYIDGIESRQGWLFDTIYNTGFFGVKSGEAGIEDAGGGDGLAKKTIDEMINEIMNRHGDINKAGDSAGNAFATGVADSGAGGKAGDAIGKGLKESKTPEEAAREQAEKVAAIFSTALSRIDFTQSLADSKYGILGNLLGPEDTPEKALKQTQYEMELLRQTAMNQANTFHVLYDQYVAFERDLQSRKDQGIEVSDDDITTLKEYYRKMIAAYKDLTDTTADLAEKQYDQVSNKAEVDAMVFEELKSLADAQASISKSVFEQHEKETEDAHRKYIQAVSESEKAYWYTVWTELRDMTNEEITAGIAVLQPPDVSKIRRELYSKYGINPDNPQESWMDVGEITDAMIKATAEGHKYAVQESFLSVVPEFERIIGQTAKEIETQIDEYQPYFEATGEKMGRMMADGVEISEGRVVEEAMWVSKEAAQETGRQTNDDWVNTGMAMMQGVAQGIKEGRSLVITAAVEVAVAAFEAAKAQLAISSPSKKFKMIGDYCVQGFAEGLKDASWMSENSAVDVSNGVINSFRTMADEVNDILQFDVDPTIRPVFDMSGVYLGTKAINSMMSGTSREYTARISAVEQAREYRQMMEASSPRGSVAPIVNNYSFQQVNNSPKPLSAIEIYRQTNNQLEWAFTKGVPR